MQVQTLNTTEYTKLVAGHYDQEAAKYDDVYTSPIQKAEDAVVMRLIEPYITSGQQVVDVGCGTGLPLLYCDIPGYYGLDVSPGMIEQAKNDHPTKQFEVADMHQLPLSDESVDTVLSLFGPLSYSLQPEKVVAEIHRVLRPGGTAILMPYTKRVQHGLELGGYSTASAVDIPKLFYDRGTLQQLLCGRFVVKLFGINYFGNTLQQFNSAMGDNLDQAEYETMLWHEVQCADGMPDIKYARHAMAIAQKALE